MSNTRRKHGTKREEQRLCSVGLQPKAIHSDRAISEGFLEEEALYMVWSGSHHTDQRCFYNVLTLD